MAKRRGRPRQAGKRNPCGRLQVRPALADRGNDRVQAMRATYSVFQGGRAANELGDPIGKAWAAGLLDHFGADALAMRDAARDYGRLWRIGFGDLAVRTSSPERLTGRAGGARPACANTPTAGERRFERMSAIVAAYSRNDREAFYGLCVDYQDSDSMPPFLERLINRELSLKGVAVAGTMPVRGDRERLERAASVIEGIVAGARRQKSHSAAE